MKKYIMISGTLFLFLQFACKSAKKIENTSPIYTSTDGGENQFEIYKIDSLENIYLIYLKKSNAIYKVVSEKSNNNTCDKIKIGYSYEIKLKSILYSDLNQKNHISGFEYNGTLVKIKGENTIWDLFVSDNLKGLCHIP